MVETGEAAIELLLNEKKPFDIVVLDVMLPGKSGFVVVSEMRQAGQFVPTLILTARGHSDDVLQGFASRGGRLPHEAVRPEYSDRSNTRAVAPARVAAECATVNSGGGRDGEAGGSSEVFTFMNKSVYFELLELHVGDLVFPLTLMEMNVLRYLIQHEGKPVSRKTMLEEVWGLHEDTDTRAIDNFIVRLRRYIEDDPTKPRIC